MDMEKALTLKKGTRVRALYTFVNPGITKDKIYELQRDTKPYYDTGLFDQNDRPSGSDSRLCNCFLPIINDGKKLQEVHHGDFELVED